MKAHSTPLAPAPALNARQRHYDVLHHRKRVAELEAKPVATWLDRTLMVRGGRCPYPRAGTYAALGRT